MARMTCLLYLSAVALASVSLSVEAAQWHPVEKYCATYKITGLSKGTLRTCQRKNGRERVEYTNSKVGFGPFKKTEIKTTIYLDEYIYSLTEGAGKMLKTKNPVYKPIESAHKNQSAEEINETYLNAMGYGAIDGTDSAGGVECNKRRSAGMGGFICMTDDLIPVITSAFGQKQILTSLEKNTDGGSDQFDPESYNVNIEEGPDVSKVFEQLSKMRDQATDSVNDQEN